MWLAECRIGQVSFPGSPCPFSIGFDSCDCPTASFLDNLKNYLNGEVRWYSEYTSGDRYECVDRQMQKEVWETIFPYGVGNPKVTVAGQFYPNPRSYMYCQQARAGFGNLVYNPSCGVNTDQVEFIFE